MLTVRLELEKSIRQLFRICSTETKIILYTISEERRTEELLDYLSEIKPEWKLEELDNYITENDQKILEELGIA